MLRVLDLFSGIGAYALGVERAGMKVVAFCENNTKCHRVLRKHWPDVPIYDDVRTLTADTLRRDGIAVDVIIGGWPCQDISVAGSGLGLDGERSGLWTEVARILGELPHAIAILENSSNLLSLDDGVWFGRVLGDLAAQRRDAEWHCLSAAAFDAPHIRDRLWIIVHPADADGARLQVRPEDSGRTCGSITDDTGRPAERGSALPYSDSYAPIGAAIAQRERHTWEPEPDVVRVVHGAPARVDRIHGLGNCNPPIIIETIARACLSASCIKAPVKDGPNG